MSESSDRSEADVEVQGSPWAVVSIVVAFCSTVVVCCGFTTHIILELIRRG